MKEDLEVRKPAAVVPPAVDPARPGARLRLHYLDGLRGLAALHVVLLPSFVEIADVKGWLPDVWVERTRWVWNGRISVQIFIALSGYCLMRPVARAGRRVTAAVTLSLLLLAAISWALSTAAKVA